jgi:hypothetical protein
MITPSETSSSSVDPRNAPAVNLCPAMIPDIREGAVGHPSSSVHDATWPRLHAARAVHVGDLGTHASVGSAVSTVTARRRNTRCLLGAVPRETLYDEPAVAPGRIDHDDPAPQRGGVLRPAPGTRSGACRSEQVSSSGRSRRSFGCPWSPHASTSRRAARQSDSRHLSASRPVSRPTDLRLVPTRPSEAQTAPSRHGAAVPATEASHRDRLVPVRRLVDGEGEHDDRPREQLG